MTTKALVSNNYMGLINSLSDEMKLEILKDLVISLSVKRKETTLESLYGAWRDENSAEDIIEYIHSSRVTGKTRTIEEFD